MPDMSLLGPKWNKTGSSHLFYYPAMERLRQEDKRNIGHVQYYGKILRSFKTEYKTPLNTLDVDCFILETCEFKPREIYVYVFVDSVFNEPHYYEIGKNDKEYFPKLFMFEMIEKAGNKK